MESTRRNRLAAAVLAVVVAVVIIIIAATSDGEETTTAGSTTSIDGTSSTGSATSTSSTAPSSTAPSTTPSSSPSTTSSGIPSSTTQGGGRGLSDEEAASVVWPAPGGGLSYDDPTGAARGFAEDLIGFEDPIYDELQPGDSRSGEIGVRPLGDGPVTTVMVRQMGDDHWYVIGAVSPELQLDTPTTGSAIDHPLQVSGRARAFEGQVRIAVHQRGGSAPLGEGFVTAGGGADLSPFVGEVAWDNPGGGWGAVVATTASGRDGSVWAAIAIPVGFIGGD